MRRVGLMLLLLTSLFCFAPSLVAQNEPLTIGPPSKDAATKVKLGDSAVELGGLWKFHIGDDITWSQPAFDDSAWGTIDLTPPAGSADPSLGTSGFIPGWTDNGYPNYSGFAWYRLRVDVEEANHKLALKMPDSADDAYQVYINGVLVGEFGKFQGNHVTAYSTQPREFHLPKGVRSGPMTIAIRMWMDSATPFNSPDAGGMHGPPVLGYASVIATQTRLDWDEIDHEVGSGFLEILIVGMALLMALALFWLDRQEKAYWWLAMVCTVTLLGNAVVLMVNFTTFISQTSGQFLTDVVLTPLRIGMWVLFWAYWFRLIRVGILRRIVWSLVALLAAAIAMLRPPLYGLVVPVHAATFLVPTQLVIKLLLAALLFVVAFYGFRRQRAEGWLALLAMLLAAVANYQHELRLIHIKTHTVVFDYAVSLGTVSSIISILIITTMLLRRFVHSQRLKEQWKLEIQQARELQQVLIPAKLPVIQGFDIESVYRPAREVGGDFFQILPGDHPGTALIVVGDVTGKGLQAGMLVALIVGAIRTAAQQSFDPATILRVVNEELCDREHATATCMILRIGREGDVFLANAGQIPPYLNGKEMELEGALPLGTIGGLDYTVKSFHLSEGDILMLMSDGIPEAQDIHGKLLGFDRVDELLRNGISANDLANAAQNFGQEDDVLVLSLRREKAFTAPSLM